MKDALKLLAVLLLSLTPSSLKSSSLNERIGIIYINRDSSYSLVYQSIDQPCDVWWENNLVIKERVDPKEDETWVVHTINNEPVIGHICNY